MCESLIGTMLSFYLRTLQEAFLCWLKNPQLLLQRHFF